MPFHISVMKSTEFMMGNFDTGFIDRKQLVDDEAERKVHARIAALTAAMVTHEARREALTMHGPARGQQDLWRLAHRLRSTRGRL